MKVTFDQRADKISLRIANKMLQSLHDVEAIKSNPRDSSTVPNYFIYLTKDNKICIFNLCLWDNGVVALEFRHPDYLPPEVNNDPEVKLYGSMRWPQYRFRESQMQINKAITLADGYINLIKPAILSNALKVSGSSKAERLLRKRIKALFPKFKIDNNYRSFSWLNNLELDIVIQELAVAIEVQGDQHFKPVWGEDNLKRVQENDAKKAKSCKLNGISLIRINERHSMDLSDAEIIKLVKDAEKHKGQLIDYY